MFTSCTMATIAETLGIIAPYSASPTTTDYNNELNPKKIRDCKYTARLCINMLKKKITAK